MCNFNIPTVLFWLFCWTVIKCTFFIYFRKRLYCPCSRTENKFNVYLKIDSDNGLGVPPRTNKTNKAWRSARVKRSLDSRFPLRNFINSAELRGILWMTKIMSSVGFLAKLKFSSEFCGKWGIRVECTVLTNVKWCQMTQDLMLMIVCPIFSCLIPIRICIYLVHNQN